MSEQTNPKEVVQVIGPDDWARFAACEKAGPLEVETQGLRLRVGSVEIDLPDGVRCVGSVKINGVPVLCRGFTVKASIDEAVSVVIDFVPAVRP